MQIHTGHAFPVMFSLVINMLVRIVVIVFLYLFVLELVKIYSADARRINLRFDLESWRILHPSFMSICEGRTLIISTSVAGGR